MSAPRRAFLKGLVSLPLIGGGVTLIGKPTAVAEPATVDMLFTYQTWLAHEFDRATFELYGPDRWRYERNFRHLIGAAHDYHRGSPDDPQTDRFGNSSPLPSSRAALVLSSVGCDWREDDL